MIINSAPLEKLRKRIALDIGNVLVHVDLDIFHRELIIADLCDDMDAAHSFSESIQHLQDIGVLDIEGGLRLYFKGISTSLVNSLKEAWYATVWPCNDTLNVLTDLIAEGCDVALLSNIGIDHADYLSDKCSAQFNHCIKHFSCNVGARKPTKLFYQSFISDNKRFSEPVSFCTGGSPVKFIRSRGLFLDDRLENIEAAKPYLDAKIFNIDDYSSDSEAANEMVRIIRDI